MQRLYWLVLSEIPHTGNYGTSKRHGQLEGKGAARPSDTAPTTAVRAPIPPLKTQKPTRSHYAALLFFPGEGPGTAIGEEAEIEVGFDQA